MKTAFALLALLTLAAPAVRAVTAEAPRLVPETPATVALSAPGLTPVALPAVWPTVGVITEIKAGERRVGLTPHGVKELALQQIRVLVQKGAGSGSGFADAEYEEAGAQLVDSPETVFDGATVIAHVKELQPSEYALVRPHHTIYTYNHFEADRPSAELALASGGSFISYEKVFVDGKFPLLAPMSRIAGILSSIWAGYLTHYADKTPTDLVLRDQDSLQYQRMLSRFPDKDKPLAIVKEDMPLAGKKVLVLGGGVAGFAAAQTAARLGATVTVTEPNPARRQTLQNAGLNAIDSNDQAAVESTFLDADVHIGTIYVGGHAPVVMGEDLMRRLGARRPHHDPAIVIDISVDQGGNYAFIRRQDGALVASSDKTSHAQIAALDAFGNIIVRVPNMPAAVPRQASLNLEAATLPYLLRLVYDMEEVWLHFPELLHALSIHDGSIMDPKVAETFPDLPH